MKIILGGKYLIPFDCLDRIQEVEEFGPYSDRSYKILGEAKDITIVPDVKIMVPDQAKVIEEELASKRVKDLEESTSKLKLELSREKAISRILKEQRGVSREEVEEYVASLTYYWVLDLATTDDVRKFLHSKKTKEA